MCMQRRLAVCCVAGWQPAWGVDSLAARDVFQPPADCQSAIQQINNLRYVDFGFPYPSRRFHRGDLSNGIVQYRTDSKKFFISLA
jgi:hypothetical protein